MEHLKLVNKLAADLYSQPLSGHTIEVVPWGDKTSTTILFDKDPNDAVELNPVVAGGVKDYQAPGKVKVPHGFKGVVAVHRFWVSLGAISRMKDEQSTQLTLTNIINVGVMDLINQLGMLTPFYKVTLVPPEGGDIFKLDQNSNAVEGRIYVIKD